MRESDQHNVFINAPFDARYEPLFITLVGTLVFLGQAPRCVLEIPETGRGRLNRIFELIQECRMSVHDLSRVGTPVRFNMPFELGLACALGMSTGRHDLIVFDSKPFRLDRTLSDYKGRDPLIHGNRCDDIVGGLLDVFKGNDLPDVAELRLSAKVLRAVAKQLKNKYQTKNIFRAAIYRSVVAAATDIALARGFINETG